MARIQVVKKFQLAHLGNEWAECYINFYSLTVNDIEKNKNSIFSSTQNLESQDSEETLQRLNSIIAILQSKMIDGKVFDSETKQVVPLTKEDIAQFPLEVLSEAVSFLAPKTTPSS